MLGKVLFIQSFPPAILNCNAFLQNRILRKFRHGSYDKYMLLYTIHVIIFTLVLYTGRFRTLYLLINVNGRVVSSCVKRGGNLYALSRNVNVRCVY